ncbi:FAD-dependent oxidoreductase [Acuticoccus kandeliae]|uniref:FAD-dependent oxidoreductase n=1 Tax=Acuticoccus kandeliae TaxID=2073160 RepID=UPI000D3E54A3|nr:FAD-dependent monooxygenase [Acuticoccus kandeliae]
MRIVIIGAGVAGAIISRHLSSLPGLDVHCLERVSADDRTHAGTGLNIGPNGRQALTAFDPPLAAAITAAAFPWRSWRVSLTDGRELFDLPLRTVSRSEGWRLRWSELYRILREEAPAIRYDCEIRSVARMDDGSGRTRVAWRDPAGTHTLDDIDLLIATDGRFSAVREALSGPPAVTQLGVAIFRTLVANTSGGLVDDYEQWFNGPNRLLAFRVPPDHIYIAGTFPIDPGAEIPEAMKTREALRAAYSPKNTPPGAQGQWLIDTVCDPASALHWARIQETDPAIAEPDANVLYLGDSSHAMVPTLGQGATQAIEGACLALTIMDRRLAAGDRDVRGWLAEIAQKREGRIHFVADFSRAASDTLLPGSDAVADTLSKTTPAFLARLTELYDGVDPALVPDTETHA